ncbi:aggregation-promoting factor C-terminal-like domain-containing protein [Cryobacterium tepidiphilum]|uniref:Lytic transglycosylase domain-containing protein n=1 Tax=Cryobacterium tepidiphilum TaxID=2486026 RepID=A0A3M8LME8_9MICO|nr:hypothetical protein [Cryobacterium tepidiphilum]RNE66693.1 hypothetical protein EEJ31_02575 [Cryobacterium tepidiphilum]
MNLRRIFSRASLGTATAASAAAILIATQFTAQANLHAESVAETAALSHTSGFKHEQLNAYPVIAKAQADKGAEITIKRANQVIAATKHKVDAKPLASSVASLSNYSSLSAYTVRSLTEKTQDATKKVQAAAKEADRKAAVAKAKAEAAAKAKAEAEARAAEEAAAAEAAAEQESSSDSSSGSSSDYSAPPASSVSSGDARSIARSMASSQYGWGDDQFQCLNSLWERESGWSVSAYNASSGATGIPQALPGNKMASYGSDWQTNPATQIAWGLNYISGSYGTPCAAWGHSESVGWY